MDGMYSSDCRESSRAWIISIMLGREVLEVVELRAIAKEQQRKVLRVNCDLDLKRIERLSKWIDTATQDPRREW